MRPTWSEWGRVYSRLSQAERAQLTHMMRTRLVEIHRRRRTLPINIAVAQAGLSFLFLALFPKHPLSIPTAYGLALVVLLWFYGLRRAFALWAEPASQDRTDLPRRDKLIRP